MTITFTESWYQDLKLIADAEERPIPPAGVQLILKKNVFGTVTVFFLQGGLVLVKMKIWADEELVLQRIPSNITNAVIIDIAHRNEGIKYIPDEEIDRKFFPDVSRVDFAGCVIQGSNVGVKTIVPSKNVRELLILSIPLNTLSQQLSNESLVGKLFLEIEKYNKKFSQYIPFSAKLRVLYHDFDKDVNDGIIDYIKISAKANELLYVILNEFNRILNILNKNIKINLQDIVNIFRVEYTITQTLDSKHSIESLADFTNMSISKFKILFKKVYSTSPHEYIADYRMKIVREKLEKKEITAIQAGRLLGYKNLTFFSRAFKKKYGVFPSDI